MKKIYLYTLTTALIWGAAGCKKPSDFGDTNVNPAATTTPIISALLTNAEVGVAGYASNFTEAISGGQYAQYFTETQYSGTSLYSTPQNSFTGTYSGILYDLQNIINLNQSKNTSVAASILQQYLFWVITDDWGDVPYSEALKGLDAITPVYDKQQDIYKGILTNLTSAVAAFDGSSSLAGDVIYGGDVAKWKKAANSLRMLVAVQMSKRFPGASDYAATQFKAALAAGGITSNADNFQVKFPGGSYKSNWYSLYDGRKDYAEAQTLTDIMKGFNDTRTNAYGGDSEAAGSTGSSSNGNPYGLERSKAIAFTDANNDWARVLRGDLRAADGIVYVITSAETWLARAEAANLGWTGESVRSTYKSGIDQSYEQWGVGAPAAGYYTQAGVVVTDAPQPGLTSANTKAIAIQRWITSYPDGHQGWNVWRKSGYPELTPAPDAVNTSKQIVRRFTYASTEYGSNTDNVNAAVARLTGGDSQDSRVWWDVQ
ncbi:SusD/RagB family nutrient-binding outer membrane lipoprotein [Inquilinus sp. KBS0705]|nr:SusD/RagB family nutrient-binding outer membrane lipoprotein [Inquilinus sp. KBS0705]